MATGPGIERVLQRIRDQIENGSYYEAQQSYKTVYHRYKAKNMIKESMQVLETGSCLLLEKGQVNSGLELANMLLQGHEMHQTEINEDVVSVVRRIVNLLPKPESNPALDKNSAEVEEGLRFIGNVIRWLKKKDKEQRWYREFNSLCGDYLFSWQGYHTLGRLTIYYARGKDWKSLTKVLKTAMDEGKGWEEELFLCRAVLQILIHSVDNPVTAAASFLKYYEDEENMRQTPMTNFIRLLLEALQIPSQRLVNLLKKTYKPTLDQDKHLGKLLDEVAAKFFERRSDNVLAGILGELFGSSEAST